MDYEFTIPIIAQAKGCNGIGVNATCPYEGNNEMNLYLCGELIKSCECPLEHMVNLGED